MTTFNKERNNARQPLNFSDPSDLLPALQGGCSHSTWAGDLPPTPPCLPSTAGAVSVTWRLGRRSSTRRGRFAR